MYESGLLLAFALWLFSSVELIVRVNSQLERNLNRIGQRHSWLSGAVKRIEPGRRTGMLRAIGKYLLIVLTGLPFVLLSWLYVALIVGQFAWRWSKNAGAPPAMREMRWKMRNLDMSFEQLAQSLHKLQPALGLPEVPYEQFRRDLWQQVVGEQE